MKKTYYSAVVVGAVVESKIADAFEEKCKPASTDEVIEALITLYIMEQQKRSRRRRRRTKTNYNKNGGRQMKETVSRMTKIEEIRDVVNIETKRWGKLADYNIKSMKYLLSEIDRLTAENAELQIALEKEMEQNRWISVDEQLPPNGTYLCEIDTSYNGKPHTSTYILSYNNNLSMIDKYEFKGCKRSGFYDYDSETGYFEITGVTKWKRIIGSKPESPKGE